MDITYLENLPKRESRREHITRKYGDMWNLRRFDSYSISDKNDDPWVIARRVLKSYIGKSFDKAFSHYCTLVKKHHQHIFLNQFKDKTWNWNTYILDNQKRIQLNPNRYKKREKPITFRSFDYEEGYYDVITKKTISAKNIGYERYNWYKHCPSLDNRFIRSIISGYELSFESKKDPLYKRLRAEKEKAKIRNKKLLKKYKSEKAELMLESLKYRKDDNDDKS